MQTQKLLLKKIETLEKKVNKIEKNMVDPDSILTEEDYKDLLKYRKEKAAGKLISHEQLKKKLDL